MSLLSLVLRSVFATVATSSTIVVKQSMPSALAITVAVVKVTGAWAVAATGVRY